MPSLRTRLTNINLSWPIVERQGICLHLSKVEKAGSNDERAAPQLSVGSLFPSPEKCADSFVSFSSKTYRDRANKMMFCCFNCASLRRSVDHGVGEEKARDGCAWKRAYTLLQGSHADTVDRFETFIKEEFSGPSSDELPSGMQGWELLDRYVRSRLSDEVLAALEDPELRLFWAGGVKEALTEEGQRNGPPLAGIALVVAVRQLA
jgi:hypothetical protein